MGYGGGHYLALQICFKTNSHGVVSYCQTLLSRWAYSMGVNAPLLPNSAPTQQPFDWGKGAKENLKKRLCQNK